MEGIQLVPVGRVCNDVHVKKDVAWGEDVSTIVLDEALAPGLLGLGDFSHAIVVFHLSEACFDPTRHLQRRPQGRDDMPVVGIFCQRTKDRPNRIGTTAVEVLSACPDKGTLVVRGLDAIDGTPVLDIKPYYPAFDKREATVPEWVGRLMERYF